MFWLNSHHSTIIIKIPITHIILESFIKVFRFGQYFVELIWSDVTNVISLSFLHDSFHIFFAELFADQLCNSFYI